MTKKILSTPIKDQDLEDLNVGDVVYLTGHLVTCRDVAHRRLIELKQELPVDVRGGAIFHAGPIVRKKEDGKFEMVSIGPTTSMRMEKFERQFIAETGVKLIVGKGGMGPETTAGCKENKAVHAIFPGGCAVLAATLVEEIERAEWQDLGMPETLWVKPRPRVRAADHFHRHQGKQFDRAEQGDLQRKKNVGHRPHQESGAIHQITMQP